MMMVEETQDSLGGAREGSTTDWTGTTIPPLLNDTNDSVLQGGGENEARAAEGTGVGRKREIPTTLNPPAKKRAALILPREVSSVETSDRTCCAQRKRVEGLAIFEGVADTVFGKKE